MAQDRAGELGEKALNEVEPRAMLGVKVNSKRLSGRVVSQALVSEATPRPIRSETDWEAVEGRADHLAKLFAALHVGG
jgi:hypothetical protein